MYRICEECGEKLRERKPNGNINFVKGICRDRCYARKMYKKHRPDKDKVTREDPFSRTTSELRYYEEIGYDCNRNQNILLNGLGN